MIVCKAAGLPDPRTQGSKNPGATNVMRLGGKSYGIVVLLADVLKGFLPVLFAKVMGAGPFIQSLTALFAVVGHMFPVFYDFKGGKGVATAIGACLALQFMLGVLVLLTWLIMAYLFRYSSLSSMIALIMMPIYAIFTHQSIEPFLPLIFISIFIVYKHHTNIKRLLSGTEPKLKLSEKKGILNSAEENIETSDDDSTL